jgi:hypothetical protein
MSVRVLKLIRVLSMLFMAAGCASIAAAQTSTTYGGEATALSGSIAGVPVNFAATGAVDPSGGARNNSLVCYPGGPECYVNLPDVTGGLLSGELLSAVVVGRGHETHADAAVAKLKLLVHGVLIKAEYIKAIAKSKCEPGGAEPESTGSVAIDHLEIAGVPISVSGLPNQTLSIPSPLGGSLTIVINEQTRSATGIVVRALRIKAPKLLGVVAASDVTVAGAHGHIKCGVPECFAQKVTGGGWVKLDPLGHDKGNFAAAGRHLSDWGHFLFVNHETGDKLKATYQKTIFSPAVEDDNGFAYITGEARVNGSATIPFRAWLIDNGEPGTNDMFALWTEHPSFQVTLRKISGGNIQFHKPKDESCPIPAPEEILPPPGPAPEE